MTLLWSAHGLAIAVGADVPRELRRRVAGDHTARLELLHALVGGRAAYADILLDALTQMGPATDPLAALPNSFDRLEMDRGYADIGDQMLLAAYPAGFLGGEAVQKNLYISSAIAYVTQLFSFGGNKKVDLFSIGGTVVSQGGSSGGAVVRLRDGKLAGIITTSTTAASTENRDLRAVSLSHIDDSLATAGKGGIVSILSGDLSAKAADFNTNTAPSLTAQLQVAIKGN